MQDGARRIEQGRAERALGGAEGDGLDLAPARSDQTAAHVSVADGTPARHDIVELRKN